MQDGDDKRGGQSSSSEDEGSERDEADPDNSATSQIF